MLEARRYLSVAMVFRYLVGFFDCATLFVQCALVTVKFLKHIKAILDLL